MAYLSKITLFCLSILLFTACNQKKQETSSDIDSTTQISTIEKEIDPTPIIEEAAFSIDIFSDFPPEVDGCSCYFSKNEADFKAGQKYSYVDDYEKTAFVKINDTLVKFVQTNSEMITETNYKSTYKSENASQPYTLEVDSKRENRNGDETFLYTGTIKITNQDGKSLSEHFVGECGC